MPSPTPWASGGGMRVGEVLKLTQADVNDRRLVLRNPKSGKGKEIAFIPQKVADRLKAYIKDQGIKRSGFFQYPMKPPG
jgi:integrase